MQRLDPRKVLVLFAIREEAGRGFDDVVSEVVFTGVGKVNAAYGLTRALTKTRPELVVSFGTTGSPKLQKGTVVECTRFVQRDMDVRALGVPLGTTPLDPLPAVLDVPRRLTHLPEGTCGTGDSFVTGQTTLPCDVVDMEAYALAKICRLEGVPFMAVKYVTDHADASAHRDWIENLPGAVDTFRQLYDTLIRTPTG